MAQLVAISAINLRLGCAQCFSVFLAGHDVPNTSFYARKFIRFYGIVSAKFGGNIWVF